MTNLDELDSNRWMLIAVLLSMDVVQPFYELMGLELSEPKRFAEVLREAIVRMRYERAVRILQPVAEHLGDQTRDTLIRWGQRRFFVSLDEHAALHEWSALLRECRHDPALWSRLGLPPRLSTEARKRWVRAIDHSPYRARFEEAYAGRLSDWDLHLYATYRFDDDESEGTPNGPDSYVQPIIRDHRAYEYWRWLLGALSVEEREQLWRNAQALIASEERLGYIRELADPSALEVRS